VYELLLDAAFRLIYKAQSAKGEIYRHTEQDSNLTDQLLLYSQLSHLI
jgi:hypothetical protein